MSTSAARAVQPTAPLTILLPRRMEPVVDALRQDNPTAEITIQRPRPFTHSGRFQIVIVGGPLKLTLSGLTAPKGLNLVDLRTDRPADLAVLTYDLVRA